MGRRCKLRGRDFCYSLRRDELGIELIASPLWADALVAAAEAVCALTGHRFCHRLVAGPMTLHGRVSRRLHIPVDEAMARRVHAFMAEVGAWEDRDWPYDD